MYRIILEIDSGSLCVSDFCEFFQLRKIQKVIMLGTLILRTERKKMHKLGLAVNTGIGRDPFSHLFWNHCLHFFALFFLEKFMLVGSGKISYKQSPPHTSQHIEYRVIRSYCTCFAPPPLAVVIQLISIKRIRHRIMLLH